MSNLNNKGLSPKKYPKIVASEDGELYIKGENAFVDICNKFGCEHLHIRQEPGHEFSEKMRNTGQKRPDFLVNIPDLTSLFVDVKVRDERPAGVDSKILSDTPSFSVDFSDFIKMKTLENSMRISARYAFFKKKNNSDIYGSMAYMVPLSRVEKNLPSHVRKKMQNNEIDIDWTIRIPAFCMNEWCAEIDLRDKCQGCVHKFCEIDHK